MTESAAQVFWKEMLEGSSPSNPSVAAPKMLQDMADKTATLPLAGPEVPALHHLGSTHLFHDADGEPYVCLQRRGQWRFYRAGSPDLKDLMASLCLAATGKPPSQTSLDTAARILTVHAKEKDATVDVHVRHAYHEGHIYIDLANAQGEVVDIGPDGWSISTECPVAFVRCKGMRPLPSPTRGGSIADLRRFVNVGSDADWYLTVGWILGGYHPTGPYPILLVQGPQGSAKSTASRLLRTLLDPNNSVLATLPGTLRDLAAVGKNQWVLAFDNLSGLPGHLSDALCRISTGGGFAGRKMYSDDDIHSTNVQRPIILNGIDGVVSRHDLRDRCVTLELAPISDSRRQTDAALMAKFNAALPSILGGLYDALSAALRNRDQVRLDRHPRMADFAAWVVAAEPALGWPTGAFLDAYLGNRDETEALAIETDPVARTVLRLVDARGSWSGTATSLFCELEIVADVNTRTAHNWPRNAASLAKRLRYSETLLLNAGVTMTFIRQSRSDRERTIRLEMQEQPPAGQRVLNPPHGWPSMDTSDGPDGIAH